MNLKRLLAAALFALAAIPAALGAQATGTMPTTGPMSLTTFVTSWLNPGLAAIISTHSGSTAPAVTGQPVAYQWWVDTSTTPKTLKMYDGASWVALGTLDTTGHLWGVVAASVKVNGSSSGTATISAQATAGTPALVLPNTSGTLADGATAPLALSATTGNLTITGAAGQILAGAGPAFTATPTLGVAGTTVGSLAFANATSGAITVSPPTGALGTAALTLPAATDTLVGRATTDTLTNKTLTSPVLTAPVLGTPASGTLTNATGLPISTGVSGLGTGAATWLGTPTSANLAATITDETGTGAAVFGTSPTLVTPALGTPSAAVLTNATGLPISTGVSGLGTGVATFLATPTSANEAAALTDETGSGAAVFATSPTLVTPVLGAATGTSLNLSGLTASNAVATDASKNLVSVATTGSGSYVLATSPTLVTPALGTPASGIGTNLTGVPISSGVSGMGSGVGTFLVTPSSSNLASAITDETGAGLAVFGTSPTLVTPVLSGLPTGTGVASTPTASTLDARDANANISANAFLPGYATTVTAAGTTTLTVASPQLELFTGTSTQTVVLPVVSTLVLGQQFTVVDNSSGAVTVNSSGGNLVLSVAPGNTGIFTVTAITGTGSASWSNTYISSGSGTGTVTSVTCGASLTGGTFTTTGTCALSSTPALGTPSSGTLTNATGLPISTGVSGLGTGVATFLGTPTSANEAAALTDETGSGAAVFASTPTLVTPVIGAATGTSLSVSGGLTSTAGVLTVSGTSTSTISGPLSISGASAGQIVFPSTQNASANANTLDDYKEGSFTPGMTFNASATGITYTTQVGSYIKIGQNVYFSFTLTLTNNGSGVGVAKFTGLPFTSNGFPAAFLMHLVAGGSAASGIYAIVDSSATTASLYIPGAASAPAATDTNCTNTFDVRVSGTYQSAN